MIERDLEQTWSYIQSPGINDASTLISRINPVTGVSNASINSS